MSMQPLERGYIECYACKQRRERLHLRRKKHFKNCPNCHGTNVSIGAYSPGYAQYPVETTDMTTLPFYRQV